MSVAGITASAGLQTWRKDTGKGGREKGRGGAGRRRCWREGGWLGAVEGGGGGGRHRESMDVENIVGWWVQTRLGRRGVRG